MVCLGPSSLSMLSILIENDIVGEPAYGRFLQRMLGQSVILGSRRQALCVWAELWQHWLLDPYCIGTMRMGGLFTSNSDSILA
jgi:hypothetical protein